MFGQNREKLEIFCTKSLLRNQTGKKLSRDFRRSLHSLGNRKSRVALVESVYQGCISDLGPLGGQSNCLQGSLTQHLPNTWQIAALYAFLAIFRNNSGNLFVSRLAVPTVKEGQSRAVGADHSRGRLQEFTPAPCQHGLLDVEGGREERTRAKLEREKRKRCQTRKSPLEGNLCCHS